MPLLAEGEFALVKQHRMQALNKSTRGWAGVHDLYSMLVDAAIEQRDEAALREYAPMLENEATQLDHNLYLAIAHRAWGVLHTLVGEFDQAQARLEQAVAIFRAMDTHWQIGRTHTAMGELALAQAGSALARDHYSHALAAFEEMKAAPDVKRVQSILDSLTP